MMRLTGVLRGEQLPKSAAVMVLRSVRRMVWLGLGLALSVTDVAAQVNIRLSFSPETGLSVEYHLPPHCSRLPFLKNGPDAALMRADWQAGNSCFRADGEQLIATAADCRVAKFSVPASIRSLSGYPAAFPMGPALYVHTSNYQVGPDCGVSRYEFSAPYLAFEGKQYRHKASFHPKDEMSVPVLFAVAPLRDRQGVLSYIDPAVSAPYVQQIEDIAQKTVNYLHQHMPAARFAPPIIAVAKVTRPGGLGFAGDAGNVLRLSLFNWPDQLTPTATATITRFVAHEFSHRFQQRDAVDSYPLHRVIHEGGAEYLRWLTSVEMGWMSHEEAAKDLDTALSECLLGTGQLPWQALAPAQIAARQLEYRCGLLAYVFSLAMRRNSGPAIENIGRFYARIQAGERPDFFQAIECGDTGQCQPDLLPALFTGNGPMHEVWSVFFAKTALARAVQPNQTQLDLMTKKLLSSVVIADCGESSMFETEDGLMMDDLPRCKQLRKNMHIIGLERLALFGNANTLAAAVHACQQRGSVRLQLATKQELSLKCGITERPLQHFYAVDIEKLLLRLQ